MLTKTASVAKRETLQVVVDSMTSSGADAEAVSGAHPYSFAYSPERRSASPCCVLASLPLWRVVLLRSVVKGAFDA